MIHADLDDLAGRVTLVGAAPAEVDCFLEGGGLCLFLFLRALLQLSSNTLEADYMLQDSKHSSNVFICRRLISRLWTKWQRTNPKCARQQKIARWKHCVVLSSRRLLVHVLF